MIVNKQLKNGNFRGQCNMTSGGILQVNCGHFHRAGNRILEKKEGERKMTLSTIFDNETTKSILDVIPDISMVWKVVLMNPLTRCYEAPHAHCTYQSGKQQAEIYQPDWAEYTLFYHFWVNKTFVMEKLNLYLEHRATQIEKLENLRRDYRKAEEFYRSLFDRYSHRPYETRSPEYYFRVMPELHSWHIIPRVICCAIHKDWITTIGKQDNGLAVVCEYAVFPEYPAIKPDPNTIITGDIQSLENAQIDKPVRATKIGNPKMMEELISV